MTPLLESESIDESNPPDRKINAVNPSDSQEKRCVHRSVHATLMEEGSGIDSFLLPLSRSSTMHSSGGAGLKWYTLPALLAPPPPVSGYEAVVTGWRCGMLGEHDKPPEADWMDS
jgi:hypothetical protein